jgi:hypothetical protein
MKREFYLRQARRRRLAFASVENLAPPSPADMANYAVERYLADGDPSRLAVGTLAAWLVKGYAHVGKAPAPAQYPAPEKGHHLHLLICAQIMPPLPPEKATAAGWAIVEEMKRQGYDTSRPKAPSRNPEFDFSKLATKGIAHSHDLTTGLPKPYLVIVEIGPRLWFYVDDCTLTASITKADRFDEIELAEGVIDSALSRLSELGLAPSIVLDQETRLFDTVTGDIWPMAKFTPPPGFTDDGLS